MYPLLSAIGEFTVYPTSVGAHYIQNVAKLGDRPNRGLCTWSFGHIGSILSAYFPNMDFIGQLTGDFQFSTTCSKHKTSGQWGNTTHTPLNIVKYKSV